MAPQSDRGTALPFVLLLGNHSSGKSSFINYVLGRKVQTTGVAPTDDAFTIIAPGPSDRDQDGPALGMLRVDLGVFLFGRRDTDRTFFAFDTLTSYSR